MSNGEKKKGKIVRIPGQKERLNGFTHREILPLEMPLPGRSKGQKTKKPAKEASYPPGLVTQQITTSLYAYVKLMLELGVVVGELGEMMSHPALEELKNALHTVMAGGTVEITTIDGGVPGAKDELDDLYKYAYKEANEINKKVGYRLTLEL